jgi:hypothetical protein
MTNDPAAHEVHDTPLANRIVERIIRDWLATATAIARAGNGNPPINEYERGISHGIDHLDSYLTGYPYTVVPQIIDELRRAGLLRELTASDVTDGMLWWLAAHRARLRFATTDPTQEQILDVIGSAQRNYRTGLRLREPE